MDNATNLYTKSLSAALIYWMVYKKNDINYKPIVNIKNDEFLFSNTSSKLYINIGIRFLILTEGRNVYPFKWYNSLKFHFYKSSISREKSIFLVQSF